MDRPLFDVAEVGVFGEGAPFTARHSRVVACDVDGDGRDDVVLLDQLGRHRVALSALGVDGRGATDPDAAFEVVAPVRGIDGVGFCSGHAEGDASAIGAPTCLQVRVGAAEAGEKKCALFVMQPDGNHAVLRAGGRDQAWLLAPGMSGRWENFAPGSGKRGLPARLFVLSVCVAKCSGRSDMWRF